MSKATNHDLHLVADMLLLRFKQEEEPQPSPPCCIGITILIVNKGHFVQLGTILWRDTNFQCFSDSKLFSECIGLGVLGLLDEI